MDKKRVVVVCPGRGTYTRETSGYLAKYGKFRKDQISWMDKKRENEGLPSLSSLDLKPFQSKIHMAGENASTLIFACSISDFSFIDQKKYEVVSIIGNSMGWYTTLVLGNVLSIKQGYELIHTMGSMMKNQIIGGQIIYPVVDDDWIENKEKKTNIISQVKKRGLLYFNRLRWVCSNRRGANFFRSLVKKITQKRTLSISIALSCCFSHPSS